MNWHLIIIINWKFSTDIKRSFSSHKYMYENTCMQNFPIIQACVFMFSSLFSKRSSIAFWEDGPHSFPCCTFIVLCSVALHRTVFPHCLLFVLFLHVIIQVGRITVYRIYFSPDAMEVSSRKFAKSC